MSEKRPRAVLMVVPPLPGERRKSSSLMVLSRKPRSKWWRVFCSGTAKRCRANDCVHVEHMCRHYKYMHPAEARDA